MLGEYKCLRLLPSSAPSFSLSFALALRFLSHTVNTAHHQSAFIVCSQELSMHIRCLLLAPHSVQQHEQHRFSAR